MNQKQLVFSLVLAIVACFAFGWAMIIEADPNPNKESKGIKRGQCLSNPKAGVDIVKLAGSTLTLYPPRQEGMEGRTRH